MGNKSKLMGLLDINFIDKETGKELFDINYEVGKFPETISFRWKSVGLKSIPTFSDIYSCKFVRYNPRANLIGFLSTINEGIGYDSSKVKEKEFVLTYSQLKNFLPCLEDKKECLKKAKNKFKQILENIYTDENGRFFLGPEKKEMEGEIVFSPNGLFNISSPDMIYRRFEKALVEEYNWLSRDYSCFRDDLNRLKEYGGHVMTLVGNDLSALPEKVGSETSMIIVGDEKRIRPLVESSIRSEKLDPIIDVLNMERSPTEINRGLYCFATAKALGESIDPILSQKAYDGQVIKALSLEEGKFHPFLEEGLSGTFFSTLPNHRAFGGFPFTPYAKRNDALRGQTLLD